MRRTPWSLSVLVVLALVAALVPLPPGLAAADVGASAAMVPDSTQDTVGMWVPNAQVNALATAPDGSTFVGGNFTRFGPLTGGGAMLTTDTSGAHAVEPWPYIKTSLTPGGVRAVCSDGQGGYFIGGRFTEVGGLARVNLAHIKSDGSVDPTWRADAIFSGGGQATVEGLARNGTTLYVVGTFDTLDGTARSYAGAVGTGGTGDILTWDPQLDSTGRCVLFRALEGVYIGGNFGTVHGDSRQCLVRVASDTGVPHAWRCDADGAVKAIARGQHLLYVGGEFTHIGGSTAATTRVKIAGIDPDTGAADGTWNPAGASMPGVVNALATYGDTVYAGGTFANIGGLPAEGLAALDDLSGNSTGWDTKDSDTTNAAHIVNSLTVVGSVLYVGGKFDVIQYAAAGNAAQFDLAGHELMPTVIDGFFASSPEDSQVFAITAYPGNHSVYLGGDFASAGMVKRSGLASLSPAGRLTSWNPDVGGFVDSLSYGGGHLYAAGGFSSVVDNTIPRRNLAAWDSAGNLTPWNPQPTVGRPWVVRYHDGQVLVGGDFNGTVADPGKGRLIAVAPAPAVGDAVAWGALVSGAAARIDKLAVSGDTAYVAGSFTNAWDGAANQPRNGVAAFTVDATGVLDWDPQLSAAGSLQAMEVVGSDVWLGGMFTSVGGQPRTNLAVVSGSGEGAPTALTLNTNAPSPVQALMAASESVYVGGQFTSIGGATDPQRLAQIALPGGTPTAFAPRLNNGMYAFTISGEYLYAGGAFTRMGGTSQLEWPAANLARFEGAASAPPPTPPTVNRFAGADRWDTMQMAARNAFPTWAGVTDVVVACGDDRAMADPLSASGLAGALDCPLLLVRNKLYTNSTPLGAAGNLLQQMGRVNIWVVGGPVAVSPAVYGELAKSKYRKGGTIYRFNGANRYNTAELVATRIESIMAGKGTPVSGYLIANGAGTEGYYDALAWAPISYAQHFPLLLTRAGDAPGETTRHLGTFDRSKVWALGNTSNISPTAMAMLWLPESQRITGADRYAKAAAAAEWAVANGWASYHDVSIGAALPDALAGGVQVGSKNGVILYSDRYSLPDATKNLLSLRKGSITNIWILGGTAAVGTTPETQIGNAVTP